MLSEATGDPGRRLPGGGEGSRGRSACPSWWFKRKDGKKSAKSVEGFLYPDTYEFAPKPTADKILRMMIGRFLTVTGDELKFAEFVAGQPRRHHARTRR